MQGYKEVQGDVGGGLACREGLCEGEPLRRPHVERGEAAR